METKIFTMRDENFTCENCLKEVTKLGYTARNHCPYCLYSKHLDINPGDRLSECHGLLKPVSAEKAKKESFKIIYKCEKCNEISKNKMANDDDMNEVIKLMSNII